MKQSAVFLESDTGTSEDFDNESNSSGRESVETDQGLLDAYSEAVVGVVDRVGPYVVAINSGGGSGSGSIITPDGFVLTNNHVVAKTSEVDVIMPEGGKITGRIVGTDPATDLALVRISESGLKAVTLGDSSVLKVGQLVIAIGNPLGF